MWSWWGRILIEKGIDEFWKQWEIICILTHINWYYSNCVKNFDCEFSIAECILATEKTLRALIWMGHSIDLKVLWYLSRASSEKRKSPVAWSVDFTNPHWIAITAKKHPAAETALQDMHSTQGEKVAI